MVRNSLNFFTKKLSKPEQEIEWEQAYDGDWYEVSKKDFNLQCCDCALCHTIQFKVRGKKLLMKVAVNKEETDKQRKERKINVIKS